MPVPLRELRSQRALPLRGDSIARRALDLLRGTPGQAWRPVEVAEALGVPQTTVSPQLSRLRRRGLVENEKGHWYALSDREVARRVAAALANRAANVKWGPEKAQDWPKARRR